MDAQDLGATGRAAIILLFRSYGLFLCWCFLGLATTFRFLLLPIGGFLLIVSTLGGLFWLFVGIVTLSPHCILLGLSCGLVGLLGMACCGLASGTLLAQLRCTVAAARQRRSAAGQVALISPRQG